MATSLNQRSSRFVPMMLGIAASLAASACGGGKADPTAESARRAPPPVASSKPGTCGGEARVNDPNNLAGLPKDAEGFCIDPSGSDKGYGQNAKQGIDGICDVFDGECEIYKRLKVSRVAEVRYVDGAGSSATLDVYLSTFESPELAYAMFTKRVVGDGDPAQADTPRPIPGGGAAALGTGNAYLWRGAYLAEITYNDDKASAADIKARADKLLPPFVKKVGEGLVGAPDLPAAAALLPESARLPLGIRFLPNDAFDIAGTGAGAYGYYRQGEQRYRLVAMVRADADQAKDVLKTFGKLPGAGEEKGLGDGAVHFAHAEAKGLPQAEWILARKGSRLVGIGDETRVLTEGMRAEERTKLCLPTDDKRKALAAVLGALP